MSLLKKITSSVKNVVSNVTESVKNPVNTIKNAFLLGPITAQTGAAIHGPDATPKQAFIDTAVGAAIVATGALAAGGSPAAVTATGASAGATVGAGATAAASTAAINTGLMDSASNYYGLGKYLSLLSNPGAGDSGGGTIPANDGAATTVGFNWKWPLIIGGGLLVLWLILSKR